MQSPQCNQQAWMELTSRTLGITCLWLNGNACSTISAGWSGSGVPSFTATSYGTNRMQRRRDFVETSFSPADSMLAIGRLSTGRLLSIVGSARRTDEAGACHDIQRSFAELLRQVGEQEQTEQHLVVIHVKDIDQTTDKAGIDGSASKGVFHRLVGHTAVMCNLLFVDTMSAHDGRENIREPNLVAEWH